MESPKFNDEMGLWKFKTIYRWQSIAKNLNSSREIREVLAVDLIACNKYKNGLNVVKKINCPTLFIFGELDKMIQLEKGKKFASLVAKSKIHIIKNCGHMIILEKAFEMREKMAEFLNDEKFYVSKSRRLRSTPFTSRIEEQGEILYSL